MATNQPLLTADDTPALMSDGTPAVDSGSGCECCGGGYKQAFLCCDDDPQDLFILAADAGTVAFSYAGLCLYWADPVDPVGTIITFPDIDEIYDDCAQCDSAVCQFCNACTILPTVTVSFAGWTLGSCCGSSPNSSRINGFSGLNGTYELTNTGGCAWTLIIPLTGVSLQTWLGTSTTCAGSPNATQTQNTLTIRLEIVGVGFPTFTSAKWELSANMEFFGIFDSTSSTTLLTDCGADLSFATNTVVPVCSPGSLFSGGSATATFK